MRPSISCSGALCALWLVAAPAAVAQAPETGAPPSPAAAKTAGDATAPSTDDAAAEDASPTAVAAAGVGTPNCGCDADDAHDRRQAFARSLMAEGDYFRAISVYKALTFEAARRGPAGARAYRLQIGRAYRLAGRHPHAVHAFGGVLGDGAAPAPDRHRARLGIGASYLGLHLPSVAQPFLEAPVPADAPAGLRERGDLLLAIGALQQRDLEAARVALSSLSGSKDAATAAAAGRLRLDLRGYEDAPTRSALLAGLLSAVIPGAGQLYTGHPVDALQAFAFVAAFSLSTYAAYRYDRSEDNPYLLTGGMALVTLAFHGANILGAVRTARFFDLRRDRTLLRATDRELTRLRIP